MSRITLCMIVRDEATMLPGCLTSARDAVDEIVIVDTGSVDTTMNIARESGAVVLERPWDDDFSAPRNHALEHATGDWVLVLDADERLAPGVAEVLRAAVARDDFDCGMLPLHNAASLDADPAAVVRGEARIAEVAFLPRLMRRSDDLRYTGIVHENVGEWLGRGRRVQLVEGADIVHLGGVPSLRERRDKAARNVRLLQRYVASAPRDITPYGYLAHEHHEAGDIASATRVSAAGWQLVEEGEQAPDLSVLRLATAHAWLMLLAGEPQVAIDVCENALAHMPLHPDLYFLRGCAHEAAALRAADRPARRARLVAAVDDYDRAIDRHGKLVLQKFVDGCTSWAGHTRRGTGLLLLGDRDEALAAFEHAFSVKPTREARWGKAEVLIGVGSPMEALALVKDSLDERPDGWVIASLAAESLGMVEQMMATVARAQAVLSAGFMAPHRRERYADALALASISAGRPPALPGPLGQVAGVMAGDDTVTVGAHTRDFDRAALKRALRHLGAASALVKNLRTPTAERLIPGIGALVDEVSA